MTTPGFEERSGRETRLLALVVVVALAVLVLLARFRFPTADLTAMTPAPGPLAGLAARATFDEMTSSLTELLSRVAPAITIVPLDHVPEPAAKNGDDKGRGAKPAPATPGVAAPQAPARLTPALRLRPDLALVHVPAGLQIASSASGQLTTVASDAAREIALVRFAAPVPAGSLVASFDGFSGFSYVGVIEGAPGGPNVRPLFVGRTDPWTANTMWTKPPLLIGSRGGIEPGAVVFSIDGRLLGMALPSPDGLALITPSALDAAITELLGIGGSAP